MVAVAVLLLVIDSVGYSLLRWIIIEAIIVLDDVIL